MTPARLRAAAVAFVLVCTLWPFHLRSGVPHLTEKLGEIEASVGRLEKVAAVLDTRARELEKRFARVVNGEVGDGG